jgi:hypothetical protein
MEAAKPISLETPNEEKDIKMIDIKYFDVILENQNYILELGKSDNKQSIIFKAYKNNIFIDKSYLLNLSLEDFFNLNIFFRIYQTVDEIYNLIVDILNGKKYSITSKDDSLILVLQFLMPGKTIDINFILLENTINREDLFGKIISIVGEVLNENKTMKNEIQFLKNEIQNLKDENIRIKNDLNNLKENKKTEISKPYLIDDLNESHIIHGINEINNLIKWISTNGDIKSINLIYRATEAGDSCQDFFNNCGEKGPTVSLIKTKKGRRFGGFSMAEWTDKKGCIRLFDKKAFLFSLDNMEKYNILKPKLAICCYPDENCLVYGNNGDGQGFYLSNQFLENNYNYECHSSRVYNVSSDYCLSEEKNFNVEEVEVYQIIFN